MAVRKGLLYPGSFRNHTDPAMLSGRPLSMNRPFESSKVAVSQNVQRTNPLIVVSTITTLTSIDTQYSTVTESVSAFASSLLVTSSSERKSGLATTCSSQEVAGVYPSEETTSIQVSSATSRNEDTSFSTVTSSLETASNTASTSSETSVSRITITLPTTSQTTAVNSEGANQPPSSTQKVNSAAVLTSSVLSVMASPSLVTITSLITQQLDNGSHTTATLIWASLTESYLARTTAISTPSIATTKAPSPSTLQVTVTSTQIETQSQTSSTTIASSFPVSATSTSGTTFVPVKHEVGHPSLAVLLPITIILALPLLIAVMFLLYRRNCPAHYAMTEPYCPIRYVGRKLRGVPFIGAIVQRRERNRAIRERQRDYMERRSRDWRWRASLTGGGEPNSSGGEGSLGAKKSFERGFGSSSRKATMTEKDEWLREDMLQQYGKDRKSNEVSRAALPTSPMLAKRSTAMLRSPISQEEINSYKFVPSTRSPPPPPTRGVPPIPEEELRNYIPGQLTGHPYLNEDQRPVGNWSLFPTQTGKPDLKALVKSARDRHIATRSMSSFGDTFNGTTTKSGQEENEVTDIGQNKADEQPLVEEDRTLSEEIVPPIPPRSPDRQQHRYRGM